FAHLTGGELVLLPDGVLDQLDERLTIDGAVHQLAGFNVAAIVLSTAPSKAAKDAAEETGLPLLLLPKGTDQGPLEREAARLITERRRDGQRRGQEVFRRLMELAIAGEPLAGVVRALAELSNRAVILEGRDGRLLAYQVGSGEDDCGDVEAGELVDRAIDGESFVELVENTIRQENEFATGEMGECGRGGTNPTCPRDLPIKPGLAGRDLGATRESEFDDVPDGEHQPT
ncbi:MAG: hypothetical protein ACKOCK_12125, partial [Chloroflexota bacterium]